VKKSKIESCFKLKVHEPLTHLHNCENPGEAGLFYYLNNNDDNYNNSENDNSNSDIDDDNIGEISQL
jgi:hypothetical protein